MYFKQSSRSLNVIHITYYSQDFSEESQMAHEEIISKGLDEFRA